MKRVASLAGIVGAFVLAAVAAAQTVPGGLKSATVSLPLDDLRGLLEKTEPGKAPVEFVYQSTAIEVVVEGKSARLATTMEVTVLSEQWVQLPLGPSAGVLEVSVDGKSASLVQKGGSLFALLNGKSVRSAKVAVLAEKKPVLDGPLTRLDVTLPPGPLVKLSAAVDQGNLDLRAVGGTGARVREEGGKTFLTAGYQGDAAATLSWRAKPAGGVQATAKLTPTTLTRVAIARGVVRYLAQIHYDISQGEVETLRLALPERVEFTSASGNQVRDTQVVTAADKSRTLVVTLAEPARESYALSVLYEERFNEKQAAPTVALLRHLDAAADAGAVALEVRGGGYELVPAVAGAQRVDVRELPEGLWSSAKSPLLFGYRYDSPKEVNITLGLTRHADVDVLVAMSDVAEAATTITADGKAITKVMYVTRNNLKQFMTLRLPEGAQLWSAFVDDRPVTPVKSAKGEVLIPLKKSEMVEADDDRSYRAQREKRRAEADSQQELRAAQARELKGIEELEPSDLKPYDVEVVYVLPPLKLEPKGQLKLSLPQTDVPVGKLAWAVFLPANMRVVDTQGNMSEVAHFSLGFRHFADAALAKQQAQIKALEMAKAEQAMAQAQMDLANKLGEKAKAEGVLPVRVELPISGGITRFEKLLTVDETPAMTLSYRQTAE